MYLLLSILEIFVFPLLIAACGPPTELNAAPGQIVQLREDFFFYFPLNERRSYKVIPVDTAKLILYQARIDSSDLQLLDWNAVIVPSPVSWGYGTYYAGGLQIAMRATVKVPTHAAAGLREVRLIMPNLEL